MSSLGINKIILLSHLGYAQDMALATQVSGVDIIIGGHSHSLLGDAQQLSTIGLTSDGPYPTEVTSPDGGKVLITQAWKWGNEVGRLRVKFNKAGEVIWYNAAVIIPVGDTFNRSGVMVLPDTGPYLKIVADLNRTGIARIIAQDAAVASALAPYQAQVEQFRVVEVAKAVEKLTLGVNSGPGVLAADSMLVAVPNAQVALLNYGGVRRDIAAGTISVGDVLEVMPYANTLVLVDLTGAELKQALEDDIDFLMTAYKRNPLYLPYVAGIRFSVKPDAVKGGRISSLMVKDKEGVYQPLQDASVYRTVVNAYVAVGGDGFVAIKNAKGFRSDTGLIDSDAFRDHLKALGTVSNPTEKRITVLPDGTPVSLSSFGITDGCASTSALLWSYEAAA